MANFPPAPPMSLLRRQLEIPHLSQPAPAHELASCLPLSDIGMESVVRRSAIGWRVDDNQSRSAGFAEAASAMSLGPRQMRIYPWGKLPACLFRQIRKLEAHATVRNQLPLVLSLDVGVRTRPIRIDERPPMGRDNVLAIPLASARRVPQSTVQATASSEFRARG